MRAFNISSILLITVLLSACGTSAGIKRNDRSSISGKIVGSDRDSISLDLGDEQEMAIPRSDIRGIDHPGNGLAVAGGLIGAYGLANIAVGLPRCDQEGGAFCTGVFLPAAVGIPMFVYGIVVWSRSRSAANDYSAPASAAIPAPAPVSVTPAAVRHDGRTYAGGALTAVF